ncbi:hypothetical protein HanIR_Chr10g0452571 [Helianthus annuus]|nr:hypothetical protein HanIR_Chr10g0452571 [Helianthus annuus]
MNIITIYSTNNHTNSNSNSQTHTASEISPISSCEAISANCFFTLISISLDPELPYLIVKPATKLSSITVFNFTFFAPVSFCTCFAISAI